MLLYNYVIAGADNQKAEYRFYLVKKIIIQTMIF